VKTYLALFIVALCSSLTFTPLVRRVCEWWGWFDEPSSRSVHSRAIPRLGGVAIFVSLVIALATLLLIDNPITQALRLNQPLLLATFASAALIFLLGVYDDLHTLKAREKFLGQAVAATLFFALGGRIEILSAPFVGGITLPVWLSFAMTLLWVIAITNAFNLIDGLDGLAAGAAAFGAVVMVVVSIVMGKPFVTVVAVALAGALIGFLRYNFNPASIFLGDSGSLTVGFLLAALSVEGAQKSSTAVAVAIPLLAFGVPVLDTSLALLRRFLGRRPLFNGDREHIHHMLLTRGWSQRRVALVLYCLCALFGLQSLLFVADDANGPLLGLGLFIVGAAVIVVVNRLNYHEVAEVRLGLQRNLSFTERRLRLANNIRVRRASAAVSRAATLDELFCAVEEMLELSDFVCATLQLK
jgi:UDP-GlcNAc:undecaprenyl-phosphate/decaprenyl-phosphate GlcNAc-1-phosphate transferase